MEAKLKWAYKAGPVWLSWNCRMPGGRVGPTVGLQHSRNRKGAAKVSLSLLWGLEVGGFVWSCPLCRMQLLCSLIYASVA
jgi:hypothetical protein